MVGRIKGAVPKNISSWGANVWWKCRPIWCYTSHKKNLDLQLLWLPWYTPLQRSQKHDFLGVFCEKLVPSFLIRLGERVEEILVFNVRGLEFQGKITFPWYKRVSETVYYGMHNTAKIINTPVQLMQWLAN